MSKFNLAPDNVLYNGKVKSWEDTSCGYRSLLRYISNASRFREVMNSVGHDELIELYDPFGSFEGLRMIIRYLDPVTDTETGNVVILDKDERRTIIPQGSRFELDTTESEKPIAYTSLLYGEKPLVDFK